MPISFLSSTTTGISETAKLDILHLDFRFRMAQPYSMTCRSLRNTLLGRLNTRQLVSTHNLHRDRVYHTLMTVRYGLVDSTNNIRLPFDRL